MADLPALLSDAEDDVAATVAEVLTEVADEFAAELADATELVAARFSVSRIREMFARRVPRIVRRLLGVAEQAAQTTADAVDADLPETWTDLPGRYDDGRALPPAMSDYVDITDHLLRAVGERLAVVAREELAAGVDAGEDMEQLRARLRTAFDREGSQLGDMREERVARTEAGRAWNTATLGAARAVEGPDRPIVKQWLSRRDARVREDHQDANGQIRLLDEDFAVGPVRMSAPHDPTAPAGQVVNCRCILAVHPETTRASLESTAGPRAGVEESKVPGPYRDLERQLRADLGDDAAVAAGLAQAMAWDRQPTPAHVLSAVDTVLDARLRAAGVPDADSYSVAWDSRPISFLAHAEDTTDRSDVTPPLTADASGSHLRHGMIALLPSEADAARLALDGGEAAEELHATLFYLGSDVDVWTAHHRADLIAGLRAAAAELPGPVVKNLFGVNHWNPHGEDPSWVWAVGDNRDDPDSPSLTDIRDLAVAALDQTHSRAQLPAQHTPWVAHVCAQYSDDTGLLPKLVDRLGPVTFDRIRVAFAEEHADIPLGPAKEDDMPAQTAAADTADEADAPPVTRRWSTPGDTALAFEDLETGDGRLFTANALYWEGFGPWPLQHADEMLMGHEGAELAGAIEQISREGQRIPASGVLYLNRDAGQDAVTLLEQGAPLGVSVDLDDVDVEFVDRTLDAEDDEWMFASARLPQASVLRMADGSIMLSAATAPVWATAGIAMTRSRYDVQLITDPSGSLTAAAIGAAFGGTGTLTAAAGDTDDPEAGIVVHSQKSGDFLMRITRARLRGATLVAMPAYAGARIVLDPVDQEASAAPAVIVAASGDTRERVVTYVRSSPAAVGPREVSKALGISMTTARSHLNAAAGAGHLVRLAPGSFVGPCNMPEGEPVTLTVETEGMADGDTPALQELEASAWHAMQDLPPMPAAWFVEPTDEELPPGSGGVHYSKGRIYGWVAQKGEPHAGFPGKKLTIESLGRIDLTHFLRAKFALDDGTQVKAGAFTMNVGHHRDGAECENEVCQFDDTRTVAGIVTVGMNARGMWFSGAAAPWLSEWDRTVFAGCQPSYHMKQGKKGWQLRGVLSVPMPGHSSPLVATAVLERSNLALAASGAAHLAASDTADTVSGQDQNSAAGLSGQPVDVSGHPVVQAADLGGHRPDMVSGQVPAVDVEALAAALLDGPFVGRIAAAVIDLEATRRREIDALAASIAPTPEEITASATPEGDR